MTANVPQHTREVRVETYLRYATCKCGGTFAAQHVSTWQNIADASKPLLIPHKCNKCETLAFYHDKYPITVMREIPASKD